MDGRKPFEPAAVDEPTCFCGHKLPHHASTADGIFVAIPVPCTERFVFASDSDLNHCMYCLAFARLPLCPFQQVLLPCPRDVPGMQQHKALPIDLAAPIEILALPHVFSVVAAANLPALQVRQLEQQQ